MLLAMRRASSRFLGFAIDESYKLWGDKRLSDAHAEAYDVISHAIQKVWEVTMPQAKKPSKRKHRACAVPLLGAAGLSLSLASGASAIPAGQASDMPTRNTAEGQQITFSEEEISDVTLATFYVFDKENIGTPGSDVQLVGHRGCGGCHHARGCHRGCGGCRGCRGCHRGCGCGGC